MNKGRCCDVLTCGKPATKKVGFGKYCAEHAAQMEANYQDNKANRQRWWERRHNHTERKTEEA